MRRGLCGARLHPSRFARRVAGLALIALLVGAPGAHAEDQPAILKAYGLDWIERVRDDAWPQPKTARPVICLLDTGVDVTPDTPADDPNGPIVARLALDGGTGTSQGTGYPYDHGTQMASIIAAPRNGWGTVGVFPQGRIVSIRVTDGTDGYITPGAVALGVSACARWATLQQAAVAAIVMAESHYGQRAQDTSQWGFAADRAREVGAVFVAAVGNDEDATVVAPLAVESILSVVAGDDRGAACPFSPSVGDRAVVGPGCSDSKSWPAGSSAATAAVGALVGAVSTRYPGLSVSDRLAWLRANALEQSRLDAGRASQFFPVEIADSGAPSSPNSSVTASVPASVGPGETVQLFRPDVLATFRSGRLRVERLDHRRASRMHLVIAGRKELVLHARRVTSIRLNSAPPTISVWLTGTKPAWRSLTRRAKVSRR